MEIYEIGYIVVDYLQQLWFVAIGYIVVDYLQQLWFVVIGYIVVDYLQQLWFVVIGYIVRNSKGNKVFSFSDIAKGILFPENT
jgi:hypothetical protein